MLRLIPPVAVPVGVLDLASVLFQREAKGAEPFARRLERATGMAQARLFGSGRAALAACLAETREAGRDEVVVPAYTCWTVPAAVVRAGLKMRLVDVSPRDFEMDPRQIADALGPRTAAVVVPHLLAPSADAAAVAALVKRQDPRIAVIEDAAQAWPAEPIAPQVDAAILSFGRGKPLPLGSGGALLTRGSGRPAPEVRGGGWLGAAALAGTRLLAHPSWYRIPESIPLLGIGCTIFDPGFDAQAPLRAWQARLGARMLETMPALVDQRTRNATRLIRRIEGLPGVQIPAPARAPGPLRLPLLVASRAVRDGLLPALRQRGVAASRLYPGILVDIPALEPHLAPGADRFPGARALAERWDPLESTCRHASLSIL